MSRNHYIPQLWLRQFSENGRINTFNVVQGEFETRKISRAFCENDIFPPELEDAFAKKLEGPFGDLLNNKLVVDADMITINRKENLLIRKFHMLHFLRSTYTNMDFMEVLGRAGELDDPVVRFVASLPGADKIIPSDKTYLSDLKMLMEHATIEDILSDPNVSPSLLQVARMAYVAYYAIWDTTESGEEYILAKLPGISLQDQHGPVYKLNTLIKFQKENEYRLSEIQRIRFEVIASGTSGNVDNYWICPLSPTRALVGISPYFKGFFPQHKGADGMPYIPRLFREYQFQKHFYEPVRMGLFEPCDNTTNQEYTFRVKQLSPHEVQFQNALALNEEMEEFVFHDYDKIRNSFWAYEHVFTMRKKKHDYSKWG